MGLLPAERSAFSLACIWDRSSSTISWGGARVAVLAVNQDRMQLPALPLDVLSETAAQSLPWDLHVPQHTAPAPQPCSVHSSSDNSRHSVQRSATRHIMPQPRSASPLQWRRRAPPRAACAPRQRLRWPPACTDHKVPLFSSAASLLNRTHFVYTHVCVKLACAEPRRRWWRRPHPKRPAPPAAPPQCLAPPA